MIKENIPDDAYVILVTGDRNWTDLATVVEVFEFRKLHYPSNTVVVHGYAKGLDTIVDVVARELGFRVVRCPAHWRHNERKCVEVWGHCPIDCKELEGRPAGAIRNHSMLDTYHPREVLGFHNNIVESKGTREMLLYAQKKRVDTFLYESNGTIHLIPDLTTSTRSYKIQSLVVDSPFEIEPQ